MAQAIELAPFCCWGEEEFENFIEPSDFEREKSLAREKISLQSKKGSELLRVQMGVCSPGSAPGLGTEPENSNFA
jgi:hypothetical protein